MEYDDSKRRRNLVVFSAAILLIGWLKIPAWAITEKFASSTVLGHDYTAPATRLWVATLAILLYLMVRFWFSKEQTQGFLSYRVSAAKAKADRLSLFMSSTLKRSITKNIDTTVFANTFLAMVRHGAFQVYGDGDSEHVKCVDFRIHSIVPTPALLDGEIRYVLMYRVAGEIVPAAEMVSGFVLPKSRAWAMNVVSLGLAAAWSKSSTDFWLPWMLAIAATAVAGWKLWGSLN